MHLVALFVFSLLLALYPSQGHTEKLCVTRRVSPLPNGQIPMGRNVNVNSQCANDEREILDTNTFQGPAGPVGAPGPVGPMGPTGPAGEQLSVYSSNGAKVGPVLGLNCRNFNPAYSDFVDSVMTAVAVGGRAYLVCISRNRVVPNSTTYYATLDCTGPSYAGQSESRFAPSPDTIFGSALVENRGGEFVLLRPDYSVGQQSLAVRSYREWDGSCFTAPSNFTETVYPLIEVTNLSSSFTVPFEVR